MGEILKYSELILDLGCGDGRWLRENGGDFAVGIDIDKKAQTGGILR